MKNPLQKRFSRKLLVLFLFCSVSWAYSQEYASLASTFQDKKVVKTASENAGSINRRSLREVLALLGTSYEVSFNYDDDVIKDITLEEDFSWDQQEKLDKVLRKLLPSNQLKFERLDQRNYLIFPAQKRVNTSSYKKISLDGFSYTNENQSASLNSSTPLLENLIFNATLQVVQGTVTDEQNRPLPGVNVILKGTSKGTTTDADGKFSIAVDNADPILIVSFIGYVTQEVAVGNRTEVNVALVPDVKSLEEVVVTALGIKKETKRLGYATATATADQITENRTVNFMNGLQGKLAGVNITPSGTGPTGTSKIRIRGQSSFGPNNTPLIVVNGIPIDNTSFGVGGSFGGQGAVAANDGGDGLSSINPDDIETMTVLKGGAAAALYGSRAKDGVIMVTTKSGSKTKGISAEYNLNYTSDTPLDFTDYQYEYGQGEFGVRPTTPNPTSGVWSFGERFQPGMTQVLFGGVTAPYEPVRDRIGKFYRVGNTLTNTVTVSSGGESGSFNLSVANMDNQSIQPNTDYNRKTINLGFNQNITKKLVVSGNIAYSSEINKNPVVIGGQDISTPVVIYTMSNSMPLDVLRDNRFDANGDEFVWSRFRNRTNPFISVLDRFENIKRDRIFGNVTARYNINDWLYVQARVGQDYYTRDRDFNDPTGRASNPAAPAGFVNGRYTQEVIRARELNTDFLIGANKKINDFGIDVSFGGNQRLSSFEQNSVLVQDFVIRGLYTTRNGRVKDPIYNISERRFNSLYGSAELSYKGYLYLNLTARNDWFSTLSKANRSILYPSANVSFVFSEAFENLPNWISYGKVRAGYSEVGSDADVAAYANNLYYGINNNLFPNPANAAQPVASIIDTTVPNRNLKPMRVSELEFGLEAKFFDNRLGLDVTYYDKTSRDQILRAQISDASGYLDRLINVGVSKNSGLELGLTAVPIRSQRFKWDVNFNYSYNKTEVIDLGTGVTEIVTGGNPGNNSVKQVVGQPLGGLYVTAYLRDDQGRQVFDSNNGRPLRSPNLLRMGTAVPVHVGGITNSFNYKGISLSVLIDFKLGHVLGSQTNFNAYRHGLHKSTLVGRTEGFVVGNGVNQQGQPNTVQTPLQTFYETVNTASIREEFAYDAGFWKLRQLTIGYDFTKFLPKNSFVRSVRLSAVGNNLGILKKWVPNIDPEQFGNVSDTDVGLENTGLPTSRSIGFNLNVKF